jgi:hypothetical protein
LEIDDPKQEGYCHFPERQPYFEVNEVTGEISSNYFSQLTAEQIIKTKTGKLATEAIKGRRNEKHDDRKLALAGLECLLLRSTVLLTPDEWLAQIAGGSAAGNAYGAGYSMGSQT